MICSGCGRKMRSANRPHGFHIHTILKIAEMAYQSEVIETQMEEDIIGPGKEYSDKDDWMSCWFYGVLNE